MIDPFTLNGQTIVIVLNNVRIYKPMVPYFIFSPLSILIFFSLILSSLRLHLIHCA